MMTESGKIQGTAWAFGSLGGYDHLWGNYNTKNPTDAKERIGTKEYRAYMEQKAAAHPNVFVTGVSTLPRAPGDPNGGPSVDEIKRNPALVAFTYIRTECNRCHLAVKGRAQRGDYRGMGCSACHIPYSVEGYYEGNDRAIPKDRAGHLLVHSIQSSRDAPLAVNGKAYTGVPVETCATCHNRGKRIGVSYQGLMESAWDSPFTEGGGGQLGLHTKSYLSMTKDLHYQKGMFCQDCHTSTDLHGDGFLAGTNLGGVEIECTDCHGTPTKLPWELPLGWGDENGLGAATGPARGVAHEIADHEKQGWVASVSSGYLRSARGNPMPKVTRHGDEVVVHTAGGMDLQLVPLKTKLERGQLSTAAQTAMVHVSAHVEKMECYACHTAWAPQCYGCHVKVDYSGGKTALDWVNAGNEHGKTARRTVRGEGGFGTLIPGVTTELRSYLRWEDPVLGINGEGRVSPLVPGCQVSATIISADGKEIVRNHIFRTTPGSEGSGPKGQLSSDMSPTTPHTVSASRSCESCHGNDKTMGYGMGGGQMIEKMDKGAVVDLVTQDGRILSSKARYQIEPIRGLGDWSQVVTRDGTQTQTVGHHFTNEGPLSAEQRTRMDRKNVCIGCHEHIPKQDAAVSLLHYIAEHTGMLPGPNEAHTALLSKVFRTAAWAQVTVAGLFIIGLLLLLYRLCSSRRNTQRR